MQNRKISLNAFQLKIIALITMTIDHIGYFIFPENIEFRIIGRLSFVIFAYFVANAYKYTSNRLKYGLILLIVGILIDIFLILTNNYISSNIFITLAIGYFIIYLYDKKLYLPAVALIVLSYFLNIDYGVYGIMLIFVSYIFFNKPLQLLLINILLIALCSLFQEISIIQYFSVIGSLLICLYNNERGPNIKYLFYIYYPLHIIVINLIAYYLK